MMRITAVVALFDGLREADVLTWVERGWVRPDDEGFREIDVARVRLIHDLLFRMDLRVARGGSVVDGSGRGPAGIGPRRHPGGLESLAVPAA
jgi:hypothetical protein